MWRELLELCTWPVCRLPAEGGFLCKPCTHRSDACDMRCGKRLMPGHDAASISWGTMPWGTMPASAGARCHGARCQHQLGHDAASISSCAPGMDSGAGRFWVSACALVLFSGLVLQVAAPVPEHQCFCPYMPVPLFLSLYA